MVADSIIMTNALTRQFGTTTAVDHLTLTIEHGEVFGLLGHNGAGKTTTVRLLNGVLNPTSGSAIVMGYSTLTEGAKLRKRTGVLTETPSLYEALSARENLRLFTDLYDVPKAESPSRIAEMLKRFGLSDRADEKVGGYSKGMKQRLALARAFLHQPDILFLDEPTAGLDPVAAKEVNDLIHYISRSEGRTVLLATHNLVDAQRLCDRVAVLEHGRMIACGTPHELAQQYRHNIRLEIEIGAGQRAQAESVLRAIPNLEISVVAANVLAISGVSHDAIPDMLKHLLDDGINVYRVNPDEPTLEDVYFALHKGEHPL